MKQTIEQKIQKQEDYIYHYDLLLNDSLNAIVEKYDSLDYETIIQLCRDIVNYDKYIGECDKRIKKLNEGGSK